MIKAICIDDEVHCLDTLALLLKEYCPQVQVIGQCRSAKKGLEVIESTKPDLVFLDIEMPGMNGFDMLEQFVEIPFAIIFITSYDQYAIKAIRFSALDYLLKPIDPKELIVAVQKVEARKSLPAAAQFDMLLKQINHKRSDFVKIAIPTAEGFELIPADEVIRCQANDNYTFIFIKNRSRVTACRTLKEMEELLEPFSFFIRVHHSWIVNLNEVIRYVRGEGGYLVMSDDSMVNVSRSRKESLLKFF
ncbi:DNA-binding response regulator [Niastella yeongjuensis]|uniref:DNA-binding response regulator n=1 Tax=Niastella yeongjuensis TaxID=354355 RepID=A0A1V9E1Q9_9BACT|nr:LytTR family DNA-binding domain-containing protein [Niastella yeongjuensis]OQP40067.1 DNA-binding response regulator [Niastella yeongjuensis]SEO15672.1 two component transcriptional regulator, LytTR family [Niastella yeongjuensis]